MYICIRKQNNNAMTDYQLRQKFANSLFSEAKHTRYDQSGFDLFSELIGRFLDEVVKLDTFASRVAETILATMKPGRFQVAYISSKQAWILACAAVENGLQNMLSVPELYDDDDE